MLGPPLWNIFFADVSDYVTQDGTTEAKFADDLNCFKEFDKGEDNNAIIADLMSCQARVHGWGSQHRVVFDGGKEAFAVIHHHDSYGAEFKLLGAIVDTKLIMKSEVDRILAKTRPKVKAILRTRAYYSSSDLVKQFKTHVLCILEGTIGALFHAASSHLESLDRVQDSFLAELGISKIEAFEVHNLMPLKLRRNIAVLGLIHRCALGHAHKSLCRLFRRDTSEPRRVTRLSTRRHNLQIIDHCDGSHSDLMRRSVFGMVRVYNLLPQEFVDATTVSSFQHRLTRHVRSSISRDIHWDCMYSNR